MQGLDKEYLVSYGRSGEFGRFRPTADLPYQRGNRVVVRSPQGVELGVVPCPFTAGHGRFLSRTLVGTLLRGITPEDEQTAQVRDQESQRLFEEARQLAAELALPLEILDVEVLFEGGQALVYILSQESCDYRPLVSTLSRRHDLIVVMNNLADPVIKSEESGSCGKPDCGRGNCQSCGTGGGCSSSSCGSGIKKEEITAYLAGVSPSVPALRTSLL